MRWRFPATVTSAPSRSRSSPSPRRRRATPAVDDPALRPGARRAHRQDRARRGARRAASSASRRWSRSATTSSPPRTRPRRPRRRRAAEREFKKEYEKSVDYDVGWRCTFSRRSAASGAVDEGRFRGDWGRVVKKEQVTLTPKNALDDGEPATLYESRRAGAPLLHPRRQVRPRLSAAPDRGRGRRPHARLRRRRRAARQHRAVRLARQPRRSVDARAALLARQAAASRLRRAHRRAAEDREQGQVEPDPHHLVALLLGHPRREVEIPGGRFRPVGSDGRAGSRRRPLGNPASGTGISCRSSSRCRPICRGARSCRPATTPG